MRVALEVEHESTCCGLGFTRVPLLGDPTSISLPYISLIGVWILVLTYFPHPILRRLYM
jgi:hypothetical protein